MREAIGTGLTLIQRRARDMEIRDFRRRYPNLTIDQLGLLFGLGRDRISLICRRLSSTKPRQPGVARPDRAATVKPRPQRGSTMQDQGERSGPAACGEAGHGL